MCNTPLSFAESFPAQGKTIKALPFVKELLSLIETERKNNLYQENQ